MKLHYCSGNRRIDGSFQSPPTAFCGRQAKDVTPTWAVSRTSVIEGQYTCEGCRKFAIEHAQSLEFDA